MKYKSVALSIALIVILVFTGLSMFWTYSIYNLHLGEISKRIDNNVTALADAQTRNKVITIISHEKIQFAWTKYINVSSYKVGYLYYSTESGSSDAELLIQFRVDELTNDIPLQIGAPSKGVLKLDIQGPTIFMELYSISIMQYDWIRTSLSLYLVS